MIDQETLNTFDDIYAKTYQSVLKYVICNCSNIEDVKDIVQNIYLEVLKKIKKDEKIPNKSYIMGITKNKVKEYYRFNYKVKIISLFSKDDDNDLIDTISDEIDISKDFIRQDDLIFIWQFLKSKKVIISKIFYLYYYDGLSIKEIAKELDISEANVKNYLYRTLKELKSIMKDRSEDNV